MDINCVKKVYGLKKAYNGGRWVTPPLTSH